MNHTQALLSIALLVLVGGPYLFDAFFTAYERREAVRYLIDQRVARAAFYVAYPRIDLCKRRGSPRHKVKKGANLFPSFRK